MLFQDAIRAARVAAGVEPDFDLDAPATAERIRMACEDDLTRKVPELPPSGTYTPWGIQV
jgi:xanthine dehydrogenase/oxidase